MLETNEQPILTLQPEHRFRPGRAKFLQGKFLAGELIDAMKDIP